MTDTTQASATALGREIKALTFDVFGTVVDWRTSIEAALTRALKARIASPAFASLPPEVQARAKELLASGEATTAPTLSPLSAAAPPPSSLKPWPCSFAAEWRASYGRFTRGFVPGSTPWKDVDAHHLDSLASLLDEWGLGGGLFPPGREDEDEKNEETLLGLSRAWHRLQPWPDSAAGIRALNEAGYVTATLSNGNTSLLRDLDSFPEPKLGFGRLFSAQDFGAYKPNPKTYLGAADRLGLPPAQIAMVAAHLGDLERARAYGLRTVYVERPGEEEWREQEERYAEARKWVDVWIPLGAGGFVDLAKRLAES